MSAETTIKEKVQKITDIHSEKKHRISKVVQLYGDASYRKYYRASLDNGGTMIVMELPDGRASASEEITNYKAENRELPFINVASFLSRNKINVPEIFHYDEKERLLLLEDLGNELLFKIVEASQENERLPWYKKAVDLLVDLQKKTKAPSDDDCIALKRSFDEKLLNWEFDHFIEYGIEKRLGKTVEPKDKDILIEGTRTISKRILTTPYGFTHRDFQSRNIIIMKEKLYLLDFQDALMGPRAYDLVSLLRDSYVKLTSDELERLIKHYCYKSGHNISSIKEEFSLVTCQRKLKDAGRFVYIDQVKGNPNYLKNIPVSLGYVKDALQRLPEYKSLYDVLVKYIPEWNNE